MKSCGKSGSKGSMGAEAIRGIRSGEALHRGSILGAILSPKDGTGGPGAIDL